MHDIFCESNFDKDILKYSNSELMWIRRQLYRALFLDEENHKFLIKQEMFLKKLIMDEYKKKRVENKVNIETENHNAIKKSVSTVSLFSNSSETSIISSISLLVFSSIVCQSCSKLLGRLINRGESCKKCKIVICKNCSYTFEWYNGKCLYCIECFAETYLNVIKYGLQPKIQNKSIQMGGAEVRKKIILKIDSELERRFTERSEEISNFRNAFERQLKIEEQCNKIRNGPIKSTNLLSVPTITLSQIDDTSEDIQSTPKKQTLLFGDSLRRFSCNETSNDIYDIIMAKNFLSNKLEEDDDDTKNTTTTSTTLKDHSYLEKKYK
uniref:RabBD domain-containing protein n=1 Tax=Strongyloides venezuelensis TaxID=75913 RepID=A0A0K0FB15_STRVS